MEGFRLKKKGRNVVVVRKSYIDKNGVMTMEGVKRNYPRPEPVRLRKIGEALGNEPTSAAAIYHSDHDVNSPQEFTPAFLPRQADSDTKKP